MKRQIKLVLTLIRILKVRTTIYDKDSDSGVIFTTQNNALIPKIVADVQKGLAENNFDYVKAIAYTNALKTSLNNQVRGMLTNNNPEEYIEGRNRYAISCNRKFCFTIFST